MKFKKIILWLLAITIIVFPLNLIAAAESSQLTLETYIWNAKDQTNVSSSVFESGDTLTVRVNVNAQTDIGGLYFNLNYDPEKIEYISSSAQYIISDELASFNANLEKAGTIIAVFDTAKKNNLINGEFLTFSFKVLDVIKDSTAEVSLTVIQAYDSTVEHNLVDLNGGTATVSLKSTVVPPEFIALVEPLKTISETSATDIGKADAAFNALTSAQKKAFMNHELYSVFSTARSRYNEYMETVELTKLENAAKAFIKDNPILKKKLSKVTLKDEEAVTVVAEAYSVLDVRVKKRISDEYKKKIPLLEERIEALIQVKEFKEQYSYLWKTDKDAMLADPQGTLSLVDNAIIVYGTYGDTAKSMLKTEHEKLNEIKAMLEEQIAINEADAKVNEEVLAYQKIWFKVLSLNKLNVSLKDKTAIELAIAEYEKLSDAAKAKLSSRYENMKSLLKVIESYDSINNATGNNTISGTTNTVTKEVIKTVTNTQENIVTKYLKKNMTRVVYWLLILFVISVICAVYSYVYYNSLNKKLNGKNIIEEADEI